MNNELKKIEIEWYNTRFPQYDAININDFNKTQIEDFLRLYSLYLRMFESYLNEKIDIFSLDSEFTNCDLNFEKIRPEEEDFYQATSNEKLNYLYIRNNLYLDRLTKTEFDYLNTKKNSNDFSYNQRDKEFIDLTFKKVIYENAMGKGKEIDLNYGPENGNFVASNNSLIMGFRFDMYDNKRKLTDEEWVQNKKEQSKFIVEKLTQLEKKTSEKLLIKCNVFIYDDFSTKKKDEIATFSK